MAWPRQLGREVRDVALQHARDQRMVHRQPGGLAQLPHDFAVGAAVEAETVDGSRGAQHVHQRPADGAAARAVGPDQGTVDIEADQFHVRVT